MLLGAIDVAGGLSNELLVNARQKVFRVGCHNNSERQPEKTAFVRKYRGGNVFNFLNIPRTALDVILLKGVFTTSVASRLFLFNRCHR